MNVEYFSVSILIIINIFQLIKSLNSTKPFDSLNISILVQYFSVLCLAMVQLGLYFEYLTPAQFQLALSGLIPLLGGLLTLQLSLIVVKTIDKKKLTTLWKTPLLALLAGTFLGMTWAAALALGFYGICLFIVFRDSKRLRYLVGNILFLAPVFIGFLFYRFPDLTLLNFFLIWYLLGIKIFNNLVFASNLLKSRND